MSFFLLQKLKMNSVTYARLIVAMSVTVETMEVDIKMVTQIFCSQSAMLTILNTPAMSETTIRNNRQFIPIVEHTHRTSMREVLNFVFNLITHNLADTLHHKLVPMFCE